MDFDDDEREYPITPEDEKAPLLSHEKFLPSEHVSQPHSAHEAELDYGSPSMARWEERPSMFPHQRYGEHRSNNSPRREESFPTSDADHLNPLYYNIQDFPKLVKASWPSLHRLRVISRRMKLGWDLQLHL